MKSNLSLEETKRIIKDLKELGTRTINFVGEGEPTLDRNFMAVMAFCREQEIKSIVFTEGMKLGDKKFARELKKLEPTIVLKCDSLFNREYQNEIVESQIDYFARRNEALEVLMEAGFNQTKDDGTTNLALNMIVTQRNKNEVLKTVKYGRENNIFVMVCEYLPTGRSGKEEFDRNMMLTREDMRELREKIKQMDEEYGFFHPPFTSYTSVPCTIYGGVHIYGNGDVGQCAGNAEPIGNIRKESVGDIWERIKLDKTDFQGECPYRIAAYGK